MKNSTKIEPDLVAFYDSQLGNGASLFLQAQSPHGDKVSLKLSFTIQYVTFMSIFQKVPLSEIG